MAIRTSKKLQGQVESSIVNRQRLTSGELVLTWMIGEALDGGVLTPGPGVSGNFVGFAVADGVSGRLTYVIARMPLTAAERAALVGRTVLMKSVATVTDGFVGRLSTAPVQAYLVGGGNRQAQGVLVRSEQIGTKLYREATYVVQGDEAFIGLVFQTVSTSTIGAHSLEVISLSMSIDAVPEDLASTAADEQLATRIDAFWAAKGADVGIANASAALAASSAAKLTSGEVTLAATAGEVFNGASMIVGSLGNNVGFTVPDGVTGAASYITGYITFTQTQIAALVGRTLRFRAAVDLSPNFLTNKALSSFAINLTTTASVNRQNQGTLVRNEVVNNILYREAIYTVVGDEARIGLVFQIPSTVTSTVGPHSLQISSLSYGFETAASGKATTVNDQQLPLSIDAYFARQGVTNIAATIAAKRFGFVNRLADLAPTPQYFNGAVARTGADGRNWGWTVPIGATGTTTLMQVVCDLLGLGALLAGRKVRVSIGMDTSANYTQISNSGAFQVRRGGVDIILSSSTIRNTQVSTNRRVLEFEATLDGMETVLKPFFPRGTHPVAEAEQYILVTDVVFEIVATPSDTTTLHEENLRLGAALRAAAQKTAITGDYNAAIAAAVTASSSSYYAVTRTVKIDGTGDYVHPKNAVAAITDASATKRYRVLIYPGFYTGQSNWPCKDYVDLVGIDRETCIIHCENPDNVALATIPATETITCATETKLENLTITIRNGRYPVHSESNGALKGRTQRVRNCHIEHLGNDGARAWQSANGGDPAAVWGSEHAWGFGSSSAMSVDIDRGTTLKSKISAFYIHTREDFAEPSITRLNNMRAIATNDTGVAVTVQPLGSGQSDILEINNCELVGDMSYNATPWIQTTLAYQPANHAEVAVYGAGNSPMVFSVTDFGRALKIESADTTDASAVAIGGTAAPIIFGSVINKPGAGGLKGYAYGEFDISGAGVGLSRNVYVTAIGQRLGDCAASPKALTIGFQGGAPISITFDQNYAATITGGISGTVLTATAVAGRPIEVGMVVAVGTFTTTVASLGTGTGGAGTYNLAAAPTAAVAAGATIAAWVSNGSMLTAIQAAIGANGTVSTFSPGERFRPSMLDEEQELRNSTTVGIPMGSVLAYDTSHKTIRLMLSSDPLTRYAGVAWEDIYPGKAGRVKTGGYLSRSELLRTDAVTALTFGDTHSIDPAAPGKIFKGGAQGLLMAVRSNAVRVAVA